jgi:hypothetical protein
MIIAAGRKVFIRKACACFFFYKNYCIAPIVLSLLCCMIYKITVAQIILDRHTISASVATKGPILIALCSKFIADLGIWYFITAYRGHRFFFYYNMQISKKALLVSFFLLDFSLLGISLWITHLFI